MERYEQARGRVELAPARPGASSWTRRSVPRTLRKSDRRRGADRRLAESMLEPVEWLRGGLDGDRSRSCPSRGRLAGRSSGARSAGRRSPASTRSGCWSLRRSTRRIPGRPARWTSDAIRIGMPSGVRVVPQRTFARPCATRSSMRGSASGSTPSWPRGLRSSSWRGRPVGPSTGRASRHSSGCADVLLRERTGAQGHGSCLEDLSAARRGRRLPAQDRVGTRDTRRSKPSISRVGRSDLDADGAGAARPPEAESAPSGPRSRASRREAPR